MQLSVGVIRSDATKHVDTVLLVSSVIITIGAVWKGQPDSGEDLNELTGILPLEMSIHA